MNPTPEPDLEDAKRQLPLVNTDPLPGFPPPVDPSVNIGEQVAVQIAFAIAATQYLKSRQVLSNQLQRSLPKVINLHTTINFDCQYISLVS